MKDKKLSPLLNDFVATARLSANKETRKINAILPLIKQVFEKWDSAALKKAWLQNELIRQNLEDATEDLLESYPAGLSPPEIEKARPAINLLHNLELISRHIFGLLEELKIRITEGILFSNHAYEQLDNLWTIVSEAFDDLNLLLQPVSKAKPDKIAARCVQIARLIDEYDIEHEERLIRGVCPVKASSIFLDILDSIRSIVRCLRNISATF